MDHRARRRAIVAQLEEHRWVRTLDLARALGVSARTIRRDISALRKQGVPVEGRAGQGIRLKEGYLLEPVVFTCDEAALMMVGGRVVSARLGGDMKAVADAVQKRLLYSGDHQLTAAVEALEERLRLTPEHLHDVADEHRALEAMQAALLQEVAVEITLKECIEPQAFHPYGLTRIHDWWHVIGYCVSCDVVCNYRLSDIDELRLLGQSFKRPLAYEPDDTMPKGTSVPIRVQFDAVCSEWVGAAMPSFVTGIQKKGEGIVVTLSSVPEETAFPWILGWGAHAHVLSPAVLQRRVAAEAAAVAQQYANVSESRTRQLRLF